MNSIKKILIVPVLLLGLSANAQIPVVDLLAAFLEGIENLQNVQEILQKYNENSTERQGVKNQRKIELQLNKINKLYRTVNETINNSQLNDITKFMDISKTLSTDLNQYLDIQGVDELTAFGMDADLSNINVEDWFENLDYDIIGKLGTGNTFEENVALLQANYDKKLNIEKFASKFILQSAIANFQLADQYEANAIELDNLINGVSLKIHSLEEMNLTMMDLIPDLMSMVPAFNKDCDNFEVWADSLALLNERLLEIEVHKEYALEYEKIDQYEKLVLDELFITAEIENYQMKVNSCNSNSVKIKNKVEEQMEVIQGFLDQVAEAMEGLGLFEAIDEVQAEPDLNVTDGERVKLMHDRDKLFEQAKTLRVKAAAMIEEANRTSEMSAQELKRQDMYRYTNQLTENLK